ncbi:isocitrate/isopropylmalate family dehydrogenase [Gordonia oryzae]|uniref:isocitrate/isopropylmalate family dehydrogenase n=1 Tax=Gordonia oryzae TaxID=2487349 RepID=UPI003CCC6919
MDGDGIGPEIVPVAREVVSAAGALVGIEFDWVSLPLGVSAIKTHGRPVRRGDTRGARRSRHLGPGPT